MTTKPFISACMIVKNEQIYLTDCLESIKNAVDEIIVVDTGSTDNTIEIARSYTEKIYFHPWKDDFAKHRNQSISYAKGKWVLIIDADERLRAGRDDILEITKDPQIDALGVRIVNSSFRGNIIFDSPRIFRTGRGYRYEGIVHEQLEGPARIRLTDLEILHLGYHGDTETTQRKFERNVSLLEEQLTEKPDDIFSHINLAVSFMTVHKYGEACLQAEQAVAFIEAKNDVNPLYRHAYLILIRLYLQKKRFGSAEKICIKSLERYGPDPEILSGLIFIGVTRGNWHSAFAYGRIYLEEKDSTGIHVRNYLVNPFESWRVLLLIAQACVMTGHLDEAHTLFDHALGSAPDKPGLSIEIGTHLIRAGHRALGLSYMTRPFATSASDS